MQIEWAMPYDWQALSDQAKSLEPSHRTRARETITVRAHLPAPSHSDPLPQTQDAVARITDDLRRAIRLKNMAMATEETYVHWVARFTRFCLIKLRQTPQTAVPGAITAYLDYLALERHVAPATQKQALNALAFLTKTCSVIRSSPWKTSPPPEASVLCSDSRCATVPLQLFDKSGEGRTATRLSYELTARTEVPDVPGQPPCFPREW